MTVIVKRVGGKLVIVIPKSIARRARCVEGTALELDVRDGAILLQKSAVRARRRLSEIIAQIDPAVYRRRSREMLKTWTG